MTQDSDVNQGEREYWAGDGPRQYDEHGDRWEAMMAPFGTAVFDAVALQPGERVLDVGCGWGATTVEAAERVAPDGTVDGIDISMQMLAHARQHIAGLTNVTLLEADAQIHRFEQEAYDAVISRFAAMLFDDPPAAFANLRRALKPGGRLAFVCWRHPLETEWLAVALAAVVPLIGRQPDLGQPDTPGPFAFADGDRARRMVAAGGFSEVTLEPVVRPQRVAGDSADAAEFVLSLPESRQLLEGEPESVRAAVSGALVEAFLPYSGPRGVVMDASAWLVTAHR
ncbi:class I SAM-dependent methyltransferase [Phytoactinopolyspora endophytica]|uniref:class I SAM-dependent methyltransferase n=1 Tax=Phytoactinopolyspora endophytica TaxID=1642495 RepID=UPI0013EBB722|nr:class I SAM-dependent methyltransferase [Phytoactinopolyspora endophytica]